MRILILAAGLALSAPAMAHPVDPDPQVIVESSRPMPVIVESTRPREGDRWSDTWTWLLWLWAHLQA